MIKITHYSAHWKIFRNHAAYHSRWRERKPCKIALSEAPLHLLGFYKGKRGKYSNFARLHSEVIGNLSSARFFAPLFLKKVAKMLICSLVIMSVIDPPRLAHAQGDTAGSAPLPWRGLFLLLTSYFDKSPFTFLN